VPIQIAEKNALAAATLVVLLESLPICLQSLGFLAASAIEGKIQRCFVTSEPERRHEESNSLDSRPLFEPSYLAAQKGTRKQLC